MAALNIFRYPGGKTKLLDILMEHLSPLLKKSDSFCDAFIGGGSVSLKVAEEFPKYNLYLNDKDAYISKFWTVISHPSSDQTVELLKRMEEVPTIQQFYKLSEERCITDVDYSYKAIYFNRTSFSGIVKFNSDGTIRSNPIGGKNQNSKWKVDCRYNYPKLKEKILKCRELLVGRTTVSNLDINSFIAPTDSVIYYDPPYLKKGKELYNKWMLPDEHKLMSDKIKKLPNKWIMSYDDCPEIREWYKDYKIIDLAARYSIDGSKNNWKNKNELLILNT
jgi:DNA adenine methylase